MISIETESDGAKGSVAFLMTSRASLYHLDFFSITIDLKGPEVNKQGLQNFLKTFKVKDMV